MKGKTICVSMDVFNSLMALKPNVPIEGRWNVTVSNVIQWLLDERLKSLPSKKSKK